MARVRMRGGAVNGGMREAHHMFAVDSYVSDRVEKEENKSREKNESGVRREMEREKRREGSSEYKARDKRWFIDKAVGMRRGELRGEGFV